VSAVRDHDSAESSYRLQALGWSVVGAFLGALAGTLAAERGDRPALLYLVGGAVVGAAFVGCVTLFLAERGARIGANVYLTGGSSTPAVNEHSRADALAARGLYGEAVAELERCAAADSADVEARLRLARLHRDRLDDPEAAAAWFRRAAAVPSIPAGIDLQIARELCELCTRRLNAPEAAAPHLARFADRHAGTPAGAWARRTLAAIKADMSDRGGDPI
jgi:hypothetical protein